MLNFLDVGVCIGVDMRREATCFVLAAPLPSAADVDFFTTTSEFVVDLLLEKNHVLSSELTENAQDALTTQKTIEASMGIGIVLCAAEDPFAFGIDFLQPG